MAPCPAAAVLLSILSLIYYADSKFINFTDCGNGEVTSVDVVPCDEEPCMWRKNAVARMTAHVRNSVDAIGGSLVVTVDLGGFLVEYPGIEPDICRKVKCPIRKGQDYSIAYDILVEDYFPEMETEMKWVVEGSHAEGLILCATARVGIKS